jgi:hypothetical protein
MIKLPVKFENRELIDGDGYILADTRHTHFLKKQDDDNLAEIARAVNALPGLVEALQMLLAVRSCPPPAITDAAQHTDYCLREIQAEDNARIILQSLARPGAEKGGV